jgi:2-amino-4-hydroxy-6-hydroxymethyldihydropteridine diphosphokinase
MNTVYLSLGSNIEPEKNLPEALRRLTQIVQIEGISSIWRTQSVGFAGPEFLNAAIRIVTNLDGEIFKDDILCSIEESMGRVRLADKNAPRTIDIDILIFNNQILDNNLFNLDHLILPLAELLPTLRETPNSPSLQEIASQRLLRTTAYKTGRFYL